MIRRACYAETILVHYVHSYSCVFFELIFTKIHVSLVVTLALLGFFNAGNI